MSHELHDGLLQWIVGAKMQVEALHARCIDGSAPSSAQLQHVVDLLSNAIGEGRRLLAGFRPLNLEESDWHIALAHWASVARAGNAAIIDLQLHEPTLKISEQQQRHLYRIIQESVGNALKHAKATTITASASIDNRDIVVEVSDDGIGFDPDSIDTNRYGLKGIAERAQLMGGQAQITSKVGKGSMVSVRIPR